MSYGMSFFLVHNRYIESGQMFCFKIIDMTNMFIFNADKSIKLDINK